eukprot:6021210-Prymnesium_polylepis.2
MRHTHHSSSDAYPLPARSAAAAAAATRAHAIEPNDCAACRRVLLSEVVGAPDGMATAPTRTRALAAVSCAAVGRRRRGAGQSSSMAAGAAAAAAAAPGAVAPRTNARRATRVGFEPLPQNGATRGRCQVRSIRWPVHPRSIRGPTSICCNSAASPLGAVCMCALPMA